MLILGASGTLGGPLTVEANRSGAEVIATYHSNPAAIRTGMPVQLDLRDETALRTLVQTLQPDAIILTAITERSGDGFADAIRQSGQHVARVAVEAGTRLIALSTDLVFDGNESIYTEDSPTRPAPTSTEHASAYASAKIDYERSIQEIYPAAVIVRTSLIYDFDPINAQVAWMLRAIEQGKPITLYADQLRCPIWAVDLARAVLELTQLDVAGLLHIVGPQLMSRYDLGTALLAALGHDPAAHVRPGTAPIEQVQSLHLSIERALSLLKTPLHTVEEACKIWAAP